MCAHSLYMLLQNLSRVKQDIVELTIKFLTEYMPTQVHTVFNVTSRICEISILKIKIIFYYIFIYILYCISLFLSCIQSFKKFSRVVLR